MNVVQVGVSVVVTGRNLKVRSFGVGYHAAMGNHFDAEMAEIVVIVSKAFENRFDDAVTGLTTLGLEVSEVDRDEGIIQGVVNVTKLTELQKLDCVNYVRTVMTYVADFPPGDPRDLDGVEDDD